MNLFTVPTPPNQPVTEQENRHAPIGSQLVPDRDHGQATTEYALVMLGAALVGVLVIGWATAGGGAAAIGGLFDSVISSVTGQL